MLSVVASARPEYDSAEQTLTLTIPATVVKGDVLVLLVVHASGSSFTLPDGWTDIGSSTASSITVRRVARMVDDSEGATLVVELDAAGDVVQGALIALRGAGSIALLVETSGTLAFAATMTPGSAAVSSLQAINLALEVWSSSDSLDMDPPAGFSLVDTYIEGTLPTLRTILVAYRKANATGALTLGAASSNANATGATFALVLRDGPPLQPSELFDPVPGNIGFLGKDNRPPREVP